MNYNSELYRIKQRMIEHIVDSDCTDKEKVEIIKMINELSEQELLDQLFAVVNVTNDELDTIIINIQESEIPF